jgi:hypothetical protein
MSFRFDRLAILMVGIGAVYYMATTGPAATSLPTPSTQSQSSTRDADWVSFGRVGVLRSRPGVTGIDLHTTKEAVLIGEQNTIACRVSGTKALHIGGVDGVDHALRGLFGVIAGNPGPHHMSHVEVVGTHQAGCTGYVWDSELRPE